MVQVVTSIQANNGNTQTYSFGRWPNRFVLKWESSQPDKYPSCNADKVMCQICKII